MAYGRLHVSGCGRHGPPTRYVTLQVAHAPGLSGTHVPWCMSGLLTRGGGENVPGIPGACATHTFSYLARGYTIQELSGE